MVFPGYDRSPQNFHNIFQSQNYEFSNQSHLGWSGGIRMILNLNEL